MPRHDALNDCEADTGAFEILGVVEALEYTEEFVGVTHVEPDTIVADEVGRSIAVLLIAHFDTRCVAVS